MSSICVGISIRGRRGHGRPMSHLVATQPVAAVADSLSAKPEVLELLRRIDGIRGPCDESISEEPAMRELLSRQLARFYSSYKGRKPRFAVHVLAKGDMVLDEFDRRARKADYADTMVRLVERNMDVVTASLDAVGPRPAQRSRVRVR